MTLRVTPWLRAASGNNRTNGPAPGVVRRRRGVAEQGLQAQRQVFQSKTIARKHPGDHGFEDGGACQLRRTERVLAEGECRGFDLPYLGKAVIESVEKAALDAFSLQTQVAHGFEVQVLLETIRSLVGHFEERVVSIVEQCLQPLAQLQCSLVAHLQKRHREARGRMSPAIDGDRQRHHLAFFLHPGLLVGCFSWRDASQNHDAKYWAHYR